MTRCCTCLVFSIYLWLLLGECRGIILANQQQPKPAYSSGIKTTAWRNPSTIQTHQNYSRVFVHNNPNSDSQYVITKAEKSDRLYPVYNAHSYGQQPEQTQKLIQSNSQTSRNSTGQYVPGANLAGTQNNRTIYKRKIEFKTIEVYEKCPEGVTGSLVYYLSCNQFLNCWKGRGEIQNCAPGTLFNPKTLECDFPEKVECVTGRQNSLTLQTSRHQKSVTQAPCPKEFSGLIPNYTDCSKFISCNNGQQVSMDCPPGTLFDTTRNVCNFPYLTTCFNGQSGASQNSSGVGYESQSQFQGQQGQYLGQQPGYYQGHNTYGANQYGLQGQQNQQNYGLAANQHGQSRYNYGNEGQYHSGSHVGQHSNIQQGINSKLDFGGGSGTTYGKDPVSQGHSFYIQTTQGRPRCNPQTQNCGLDSGASTSNNYGHTSAQNCNPQYQNCDHSLGQGQGQFFVPGCDSRTQNCGQSYGSTQQTVHGHSQTQEGYGQQNFHRVCNINDSNCQRNTTVAKKSKEPKCPDGFQGITKHPSDCKKFLNCANGRTFIQDCAPGTLFNPAIGNCDFPYNVDCSTNETDEATERYGSSSTSEWQRVYQEHVEQYGQNAGHGNIRTVTTPTPQYQPSYTTNRGIYNQGHTQGTHGQGQGGYYQGQFNTDYAQGQSNQNQGSYSTSGIKTSQNQKPGGGVTVIQPLTPRPTYITNIPRETVVNIGQTGVVSRPAPTHIQLDNKRNNAPDYLDISDPNERTNYLIHSTTTRSVGKWPPPFPSTDINADYVFEYEDGEPVTLEPENVFRADNKKKKKADCGKGDFYCSSEMCISKSAVCDAHRDCQNGKDELECQEYLQRFALSKNSQLNVLEDQRWINVSQATCALLCIRNTGFECRSFNYRKMDKTCFLSSLNVGLTGALRPYYPYDYYELKTASIDCALMFKCNNNKCITSHQLCDGFADCADREDEKNCKAEDFGYSIKLAGTGKSNEGRVEVTAFGKTGYICDDQFGMKDANVVCRELGFQLGAAEIKGNSYFAADIKEKNTLYMIDDLDCLGNETTLIDCSFPGWGVHNCRNQEIAGVVCKTPQEKCGKDSWKCDSGNECIPYSFVCDGLYDCTDDTDEATHHCEAPTQLRLTNGTSDMEGRLEIKHHGIWGTICDDDFNEDAAKIVCKHFGFKGAVVVKKEGFFGPGEGPIWLDQVSCYGNETELRHCTHWNWGEHNCDHTEDVGIICSNQVEAEPLQRHSKINVGYKSSVRLPENTCGFRKDNQFLLDDLIHTRVVSGSVARKGDYPWQAALRIKGKAQQSHHWCGAVILASQWVLTAAHCLMGYAKGAYMIVAGEYNTDEDEGTEQTKYIEEYFIHENFTEGERVMRNDIALVKVKGVGFSLNEDIQPICLPEEDVDYERDLNCTISGFGSVKTGNSAYSHNLMAAWVPIIRTDICKMPHVYDTTLSEGMICAGFLSGGVDSCHGDSGGPLACLDNGLFTLYGITSWGHRCGFANKPGVYVKVAHYRKWIDDTITNNS
ncbi:uncharacterized protein LOC108911476 [Anoplophora glabripennis]|uniref:uncharacterized protein LOC108911476 n=1 Tax=Anoplophora glabripennis TaxID=217634 RepID=UPI0008756F3D|nr:uncharacterized protein LOC108911476 [Anoplophora glabripennis]